MTLKTRLPGYAGIGIQYDETLDPFFEVNVLDALSRIQEGPFGQSLLSKIADASPGAKGDLPDGAKVLIIPPSGRSFMPRGKMRYGNGMIDNPGLLNADQRHMRPEAGNESDHFSSDQTAASDQSGSTCTVRFTNRVNKDSKGNYAPAYITLAHELIHAWHSLYGIKKDGREEELFTVGLGTYENEDLTENNIRMEHRLSARKEY